MMMDAGRRASKRKLTMVGLVLLMAILWLPSMGHSQEPASAPSEGGQRAQEATDQKTSVDHTFDEMVVTATRTATPLSQSPAAVSVVTKEDIEKRNIEAVDTVVDLLPGVYDKHSKGLDTTARVIIRGIPDQKRTLVLLDGQPMNDGYTGNVNWNGMLPENIEKVEVARGPFSSLYGGNAMGGVVNILTRMPEKREITFKGGAGSDGFVNVYGSYGDKVTKNLSLFGSYGYQASNGYPTAMVVKTSPYTAGKTTPVAVTGAQASTDAKGTPTFVIGDTGDNSWWRTSGNFKLAYDLTDDSRATFSYMRNWYGYDYDTPHSYLQDLKGNSFWSGNALINDNRISVSESNFLNAGGERAENIFNLDYRKALFTDGIFKISAGLNEQESNWYVTPKSGYATRTGGAGTLSETPSLAFNSDLQLSLPILDKHLLTVGGGYRYDWAKSQESALSNWKDQNSKTGLTYESEGYDNTYSLFTEAEIAILRNLKAYVGLRGDWWQTYDGMANQIGTVGFPQAYGSRDAFSLSPKGSLVYNPFEKTTLRTSIGRSFRPPSVYELYRTWYSAGTVTTYNSNPLLDPETSISWDIGVEQRIWDSAVFRAAYFYNRLYDMIYLQTVSDVAPKAKQYFNVDEAETDGVEVEWDHRLVKWFRYFANFTYTHSKMISNPMYPATVGKMLTGVPEYMFNLGGEVTYGPASLQLTGRYVSKQYADDENLDVVNSVYGSYDPYFVADLSVRYAVTKNAILGFAIDNLFDQDYFAYYQAPGRKFYGSLTFKF